MFSFLALSLLLSRTDAATLVIKHKSDSAASLLSQGERLRGPFARYELVPVTSVAVGEALRSQILAKKLKSVERIDLSVARLRAMTDEPFYPLADEMKDPPFRLLAPARSGVDRELSRAWGWHKVDTARAWQVTQGSEDIIVAVIDSGIDYNHEDLQASLYRDGDWFGWDFVNDDALPYDDLKIELVGHIGHGTHASSIIAAQANNGVGFAGIAPRVKILPLKFLNASNRGEDAHAIAAFSLALEKGAKIINASWGGTGDPNAQENLLLKEAIEILRQQGVLLVAAAGNSNNNNDGSHPVLPATYPLDNIISVAKSDKSDGMPSNSGHGKRSVHLMAPGQDVLGAAPNNKYRTSSGTSFAVPHVVGALALVWAQHPEWTYLQVKEAVLKSVDPASRYSRGTITNGRVNAAKALR
jgi:subtilisin family serine protease